MINLGIVIGLCISIFGVAVMVKSYLAMRDDLSHTKNIMMKMSIQAADNELVLLKSLHRLEEERDRYREEALEASYQAAQARFENAVLRERLAECFNWLERNRKPREMGEVAVFRDGR